MTDFTIHPQLEKDSHFVTDLPLCRVLLIDDCQYPWLVLVPRVADIREVIDLSQSQQQVLWQESALVSQILKELFQPDKLNVAALGNMVPQLHIHHIVRYTNDACWPKPVWGQKPAEAYSSPAMAERVTLLKNAIKKNG